MGFAYLGNPICKSPLSRNQCAPAGIASNVGKTACARRYVNDSTEARWNAHCAFSLRQKFLLILHLNTKLIQQLVQANIEIEQITGTSVSLNNMEVRRWPGVIEEQDFDKTSIEKKALRLFSAALDDLVATRERGRWRTTGLYTAAYRLRARDHS